MIAQPVAEGLFTAMPEPRLIGGRRRSDGRIVFPMPHGPAAADYEPVTLRPDGVLWSFTIQRFQPPSPPAAPPPASGFRPYAVGYVELAGEVIVESRLAVDDFATLSIGQAMRLITIPFAAAADGAARFTFAFTPA